MKLICPTCGELHAATIPHRFIQTGLTLMVTPTMMTGAPMDYLNVYSSDGITVEQYIKLQCPRCGKETVEIVDTDPVVYGDTTTTIRMSKWKQMIKNALWGKQS